MVEYNSSMMNHEPQQSVCPEEPEISQLKEWLSKVDGEYLAYLKGASKALLYVQETQGQADPTTLGFEHLRGD